MSDDEGLSMVARTRILEYQRASRRFDQVSRRPDADTETVADLREAVEDAEGNLLALGIDPHEARRMRVDVSGDR